MGKNAVVGRFAPSPTGDIHLGNVWVALISYLSVRQRGGRYIVRMEDIDRGRSKRELGEALLDDLEWLGFDWDEGPRCGGEHGPYWQSERFDIYGAQLARWEAEGRVYPCYCRRSRLKNIAAAPHQGEDWPRYDGHCYGLSQKRESLRGEGMAFATVGSTEMAPDHGIETAANKASDVSASEGISQLRDAALRLHVEDRCYEFVDRWQGPQRMEIHGLVDDAVLRRADGAYAYQLAVVMDDLAMGVTEVIRGVDLLGSTAFQQYVYEALGAGDRVPSYGHVPLLVDGEGVRLSKRQASVSIKELREAGLKASEILGLLARLGGLVPESRGTREGLSLTQLLDWADLDGAGNKLRLHDICCETVKLCENHLH